MMFLLDLAFAMELIALGLGVGFLIWAYRTEGVGVAVAKVFGYIITIAAVSVLLCTSFYGVKYWGEGYFSTPMEPMLRMKQQMMQNKQALMQDVQQNQQCPMMQRMQQMSQDPMMQQMKQMQQDPMMEQRMQQLRQGLMRKRMLQMHQRPMMNPMQQAPQSAVTPEKGGSVNENP